MPLRDARNSAAHELSLSVGTFAEHYKKYAAALAKAMPYLTKERAARLLEPNRMSRIIGQQNLEALAATTFVLESVFAEAHEEHLPKAATPHVIDMAALEMAACLDPQLVVNLLLKHDGGVVAMTDAVKVAKREAAEEDDGEEREDEEDEQAGKRKAPGAPEHPAPKAARSNENPPPELDL